MTREQYLVRPERDGRYWFVDVAALPGCHTQARRLDQVEGAVREAIANWLEIEPDAFDVYVVRPKLDDEGLDWAVSLATGFRGQAALYERLASLSVRIAALDLVAAGFPMRDVGSLLGVTHQRVAQLLEGADRDRLAAELEGIAAEAPRVYEQVKGVSWPSRAAGAPTAEPGFEPEESPESQESPFSGVKQR
jgi:predicted RNase H-like HicB family nuclease